MASWVVAGIHTSWMIRPAYPSGKSVARFDDPHLAAVDSGDVAAPESGEGDGIQHGEHWPTTGKAGPVR